VLSRDVDNKVVASTSLRFEVAVKDTGENLETKIPVTLTIQKQGTPIKKTQTIQVISPGQTKVVVFRNTVQGPAIRQVTDGSDRFWDVLTWRLAVDR